MVQNLLFFYIYDSFIVYFFLVFTYLIFYFNKNNEYNNLIVNVPEIAAFKTRPFTNSEFFNNGSSIVLDTNTPFLRSFKSNSSFLNSSENILYFFFYKDANKKKEDELDNSTFNIENKNDNVVIYHNSIPNLVFESDSDGTRFILSCSDYIKRQALKKDSK